MKLQDLHIHIKFLRFQAKHIALKWPIRIFSAFVILAFLSPFIANDKPLICKYKGEWLFPAFSFQNKKTINYNNEV